jgi:hypothetical protein
MVSVAASSHPSRRERESERETTSRSRAGRSRGHTDTTTVMLESQPTARTMASPPTAVGPDAALLAAPSCSTPHLRPERRPQQPSSGVTMLPTRHHRHQHATPGGAVPTICAPVALSVSSAYAIRGTGAPGGARCALAIATPRADGQLPDDGPQREDQPPSRWGGQSNHHRAQP